MSPLMLGEIYINMARTHTPQETSHLQFELVVLVTFHQFWWQLQKQATVFSPFLQHAHTKCKINADSARPARGYLYIFLPEDPRLNFFFSYSYKYPAETILNCIFKSKNGNDTIKEAICQNLLYLLNPEKHCFPILSIRLNHLFRPCGPAAICEVE